MPESQKATIADLVTQARERLNEGLRAQGEELQRIEQGLQALRARQQQLEEAVQRQLETLAAFKPAVTLEKVLASVRNLITATIPDQVFDVLTEEAVQMGVRAAVFDVRGRAAWGTSARGFGPGLSQKVFRGLVVHLTPESPFRQVCEIGGHVDVTAEGLKKHRNLVEKFKPRPKEPILLLPVRSAGTVSAIFYADTGEGGSELPVDALKILTEFAGAQLDRLMALSGGLPAAEAVPEAPEAEPEVAAETEATAVPADANEPEAAASMASAAAEPAWASPAGETAPAVEPAPSSPSSSPAVQAAGEAVAAPDVSHLSEDDQKVHRDAKRFAKLLVAEIELYNKPKVSDGRKNKDLYRRLRTDIDRSRHTYEKRFGKTVAKQHDYFHEQLVSILAANEPSCLGSDYPGPSA